MIRKARISQFILMLSAVSGLALASSAVDAKSFGMNARSGSMGGAQRSMLGVERRGMGMANSMRTISHNKGRTSHNKGRTAKTRERVNPERKFLSKGKTTQKTHKKTVSKTPDNVGHRNRTRHAKLHPKTEGKQTGHRTVTRHPVTHRDDHTAHKKKDHHHIRLVKGPPGLKQPPQPPVVETTAVTPPTGGRTREKPGTGNPNAVPACVFDSASVSEVTFSVWREAALREGMRKFADRHGIQNLADDRIEEEFILPFVISIFPAEPPVTSTTDGLQTSKGLRELNAKLADLYKKIGLELTRREQSWVASWMPNFGSYDYLGHLYSMAGELEHRIWIYKTFGAHELNRYDNGQAFGVIVNYTKHIVEIGNTAAQTQMQFNSALRPLEGPTGIGRPQSQVWKKPTNNGELVDVLPDDARQHILFGDGPNSGKHLWPGRPSKTAFPLPWKAEKIVHEVGDIVTSPNTTWYAQSGSGGYLEKGGKAAKWVAWEIRDGIRIRVIYQPATCRVVSAFPDAKPIPPAIEAKLITNLWPW
ncbi:MAG: EndoU domain-containing protein [Xanthobacteraceae bacterium]